MVQAGDIKSQSCCYHDAPDLTDGAQQCVGGIPSYVVKNGWLRIEYFETRFDRLEGRQLD
jgi:hypothetical protein